MSSKLLKRYDPLSPIQRSVQMAKVRAKKNRSTEMRVAAYLIRSGLCGWRRHATDIPGRPDFCFVDERVAVFVDGCFWHGCQQCRRNLPHARRIFWRKKIESNRRRDRRIGRLLRSEGYSVIRIWEHSLGDGRWMARLHRALRRCGVV
jgi:DNA mismatch endonuclease (patch repair protein)